MSGGLARLYRGQTDIDFIGRRKLWFALSGLVVGLCILTLATKGLNYGIEFEGGVAINAPIAPDGPLADAPVVEVEQAVRRALAPVGASDAQVQIATDDDGRHVIVQSKEVEDPERQQQAVRAVAEAAGTTVAATDSSRIGSKWGGEITRKAVRALITFIIVVLLFISWRFEWKMAIAAIAALVHDLLITAGVYSLVGFEVTPSTVIAILTILGYSLYDTVVVFDKVEEDAELFAAPGKMTYADAANRAMNEVVMRSLNTSLSSLLPVAALLFVGAGFLGASTLKDLSLALFVGLLVGTYSSIFVATPLLTMLKEREPKYQAVRERLRRIEQRATPAMATSGAAPAPASDGHDVASPSARPTSAKTTTKVRSRAGSKKAKRRKRR